MIVCVFVPENEYLYFLFFDISIKTNFFGVTSRNTPFKMNHLVPYGLEVALKDVIGQVFSVCFLFCVHFVREENTGNKRAPKNNLHLWESRHRVTNYTGHHDRQHPVKWAEYQQTNNQDNKLFFNSILIVRSLSISWVTSFSIPKRIWKMTRASGLLRRMQ